MIEDNTSNDGPSRRVLDLKRTDRALAAGVRAALERHAKLGQRVAIWRDGRVAWLEPAELLASLDASASSLGEPPSEVIEGFREQARFFSNPGREQREAWVLERWLDLRGLTQSAKVEKSEAPDFFVEGQAVEVVEVQRPGRRRHDEEREDAAFAEGGAFPPVREGLSLADARQEGGRWILNAIRSKSKRYGTRAQDWLLLVYANFFWSESLDYEPLREALRVSPPVFRAVVVLTGNGATVHTVFSR